MTNPTESTKFRDHPVFANLPVAAALLDSRETAAPRRVFHWEATMPPTRGIDRMNGHPARATVLSKKLQESSWNSEVASNGKVVTWIETIPEDVDDLTESEHIRETTSYVGAHCSDTIGPKSRKASLRFHFGNEEWSLPMVCEGAW